MTTIVTQEAVHRAAERLGIAGTPSCVHASLRSFGWVDGGAISVVEGLLAAQCTVLVPTFSSFDVPPPDVHAMRPPRNGWENAYAPRDESGGRRIFTPASMELDQEDMGSVSAAVLAMRNRMRGNHPLNSFTAVGPLAHDLIDGQEWMGCPHGRTSTIAHITSSRGEIGWSAALSAVGQRHPRKGHDGGSGGLQPWL